MNYKRGRPRTCITHHGVPDMSTGKAPRHWNVTFHTRPKRRRDAAKLAAVRAGADADGIVWDLGNSKPHEYYW